MNALVIAGGQWQVPLITFLKNKGYYVFVADPYDDSLGVLAGNIHIKADVRDVDLILNLIKDIKFDIVTTDQSDISVDAVAIIAQKAGLNGNDISAVKRFSNKYLSREYARQQQISIPEFALINDEIQVKSFIHKNGLPVIIKPCDAQSSKGIHKISEKEDGNIAFYIKDALQFSKQNSCLIESFVDGYEITVEGYCSDGKHRTLAISKKKHFRTGIASSLIYPAELPVYLEKQIVTCNDKYVENSGLKFGITHAEYIVDETAQKFYLIEIACRGGGTLISSDIIKWVSDFNVYEALHLDLIGKPTNIQEIIPLRNNAILYFFEFAEGKIKRISGIDDIKKIDGVLEICLNFVVGDTITKATDDRGRQGFVILLTKSVKEQSEKIKMINELLKLEYE